MKPFLLFLVTFVLEVHVHAATLVTQEPPRCLQTKNVCAVGNDDERGFEMKVGDADVTLDRGSAVIRKSDREIRLVKGTVWIRGNLTVTSEFGSARSVEAGDFWVSKNPNEMAVMAVSTDVELQARGSSETLTVSEGLQNTLGEIGFNGQASTGLPMPIPFKDFVMRWGRLYKGPKKAFETQVDSFHAKWEEATQASATINKALFDRKVASIEEAARSEAEKKAKVEAENRSLREMFRRKNGL
jgi:hypothetical protein